MELFFRKHFWTVNLAFILLAAYLVARTVNVFVESAIAPVPRPATGARAQAQQRRAAEPVATLSLDTLSRVTGIKVPQEVAVVEPDQPQFDENAAPVKSGLRVRLLGTLVAASQEWSFASIQDVSTQRSQTYMVGDSIMGAEVLSIERERVIVKNAGRKEFIDSQPGDGSGAPVAPPLPTVAEVRPPSGPSPSGIKAVAENQYEVPRAEIDRTLSNLNEVAMQARIVPAFKDGQAQGFKLFSIRPDSIYSKIGVQNGDVIKRINGFDLNSPEKALEVYSKLKESNRIEIELERNGQAIRKQYDIR